MRVWESNLAVYRKIWRSNMLSSLLQPFLYLLGMGVGVGTLVDQQPSSAEVLGGVEYFAFLAPALIITTVMMTLAQEAMWPVLDGFLWSNAFRSMYATPLDPGEITAGTALGRAVGNARRRAAAARAAQPSWHHLDNGMLCINQFGFYLRTPTSLLWWDWGSILECHMVGPGRVGMLGMTQAGQCTYLIESDLAELVFASWAVKRQPQHAQFLHRVWLLPDWIDRYRAVYGPEAFDFTVPFRGQLG